MNYNYWKPVFCGILLTAVISAKARPAENHIESLESDRTEGVQILEFSPPSATTDVESESANKNRVANAAAFRKLFYNVPQSGSNIPVQVIYDAPEHYDVGDSLQKSRTHYDSNLSTMSGRSSAALQPSQTGSVWPDIDNAASYGGERDSKHRNLSDVARDVNKENLAQYFYANSDDLDEPVPLELKSLNRTKNPFAFIVASPEHAHRVNGSTKKKVPVILQMFAPAKNEYNDTVIERIDHKYLIPILEKLKLIANRHKETVNPAMNQIAPPAIRPPTYDYHPFNKVVPNHLHHYLNMAPHPFDNGPYLFPSTYHNYVPPNYYYPYNYHYRHWPLPMNDYMSPYLPQEPYNFRDLDYGAPAEHCHHFRMARNSDEPEENSEEDEKHEIEQQTEANIEDGKRRYDDSPTIEYIDHIRPKRSVSSKKGWEKTDPTDFRIPRPSIFGNKFTNKKEELPDNKVRGSDIGPQISKLIVRRGGVAIAGAGGIATAGSGGTAIVGPGGTAYTTPASSGGVAMVGPGGKVVHLPSLSNVLYGRTAGVTATGAGPTTFTNKQGEVFTTSENTGGVALVNQDGNLFGVSDNDYEENENSIPTTDTTKEVHLPAGARLLTTGPIIYYNPVYPTHHSS